MNRVESFLKDLTYNSKYEFLDFGANKSELEEIGAKRGIKLPAHDLAVFKCIYAYLNKKNLNNCTLPAEEVASALDTLVGKAINFDHLRKNVVGHWIDAKIDGDKIITYGIFFKGNFREDYELVKKLFDSGNLAISFEAYGNREYAKDGSYSLKDIEFSGGALLIKTSPAFPGSNMLELANQNTRVLEFAKVMSEPTVFVQDKPKTQDEMQCDKQNDDEDDMDDVMPQPDPRWMAERLTYQQKKSLPDDMFAVVIEKNGKKIRKYVINDPAHVRNALSRLGQEPSKEGLHRLGVSVEEVKRKVLKRARELEMTDLLKIHNSFVEDVDSNDNKVKEAAKMEELKKELETLKAEFAKKVAELQKRDEELASIKTALEQSSAVVEQLKKESADAKSKIELLEKETSEKIALAKTETAKLIARKAELAGIEMSDADLLDDSKFELAKMKKTIADKDVEIAKLKEEKASKEEKKHESAKKDLTKGSKDKNISDELAEKEKEFKSLLGLDL